MKTLHELAQPAPPRDEKTAEIRYWLDHCWLCEERMEARHCKLICPKCGFRRDCSDP